MIQRVSGTPRNMHFQFNIMYMYEGVTKNKPMLQVKQEIYKKGENSFLSRIVQSLKDNIIEL